MTILAQDTFSRANQAGWGTSSGGQVWSAPRGSATYAITSNEGVNSANGGTLSVAQLGTATNQEVLTRLNPADTTSNIGCIARFVDANNFYYGVLVGSTVVIGKDVSGSFSTLTSAAFSYSAANFYWLRFNVVGTTLKLRAWQDGTSEPTTWTITTTDSSLSSGGYGLGSDASGATSFDSLTVTDGAVALAATLTGAGTLAETLAASVALAAGASGSGTLIAALACTTAFTAASAGVGTLSGTLAASASLAATCDGIGTVGAPLSLATALATGLAGVGTLSDHPFYAVALDGLLGGLGTLSGVLSGSEIALTAGFAGSGTLAAILSGGAAPASVVWKTRDLDATWTTRNMQAIWKTRDLAVTWKTRDE